jgi:hypothetical protein
LIKDHHSVFVLSDGFCEAAKEHLHRGRIGIRQHQREGIVRARLNSRKDVGEGEALIAKPRRALAALPPDMADAALLADACFILEEQPEALVFMRMLNVFQQRRGSF